MKKLAREPIANYMNALARPAPVPGSGSSGALVGALGAALLEMSMGYSKISPNHLTRIRHVRLTLIHLVDEDAKAYAKVARSWKKGLTEKKKALRDAVEVPRVICQNCQRALRLTNRWSRKIKPALRGDWTAGKIFLKAAIRAESLNVEQNLKTLDKLLK